MGLRERLLKKKQKLLAQMEKGRKVSEQMKAERIRKKVKRVSDMKPGAKRAIVEGLMMRKSPVEVMREEYERRKYKRMKKE